MVDAQGAHTEREGVRRRGPLPPGRDEPVDPAPPRCEPAQGTRVSIERVQNPDPQASFGFLGDVYEVQAPKGISSARLLLPVDFEQVGERELDPSSLSLFRWEADSQTYRFVAGSGMDFDQHAVVGEITVPGRYTIIGRSTNPWIQATVGMLGQVAGLMRRKGLGPGLRDDICKVILCRQDEFRDPRRAPGLGEEGPIPGPSGGEEPIPGPPGGMEDPCGGCLGVGGDRPGRAPENEIPPPRHGDGSGDGIHVCEPTPVFALDDWLDDHPTVAGSIVWHQPRGAGGAPHPYPQWSQQERDELAKVFNTIRAGGCPGLAEAPSFDPVLLNDGSLHSALLEEDQAWDYFLAYVAQSLAADINGWVPWSLSDYGAAELRWLLNSETLFEYASGQGKYAIIRQHHILVSHGAATMGDPCRIFAFLRSERILGATRRQTIVRMIDWCRHNLAHFVGGYAPDNLEDHWQYQGWPPVERIIRGTDHRDASGVDLGLDHWTAGCWGTTAFLQLVLRTANIPVEPVEGVCHMLPHFLHEGLALSHGDDPYNRMTHASPAIPAEEILIDEPTFQSWFGPGVSRSEFCGNIGRRTDELAVEYLPHELLRYHCEDQAQGNPPANSRVLDALDQTFTLQELQSRNLWQRMDAKLASMGGCDQIPT